MRKNNNIKELISNYKIKKLIRKYSRLRKKNPDEAILTRNYYVYLAENLKVQSIVIGGFFLLDLARYPIYFRKIVSDLQKCKDENDLYANFKSIIQSNTGMTDNDYNLIFCA